MDANEIFENAGAIHAGHVQFRNGMHGNGWIQKDLIVRNPKFLDKIAILQAEQIKTQFSELDLIMGPVTGGAIIASYVARHAETELGVILGKQDPVLFHDMNVPSLGQKVVIVEDIISSGTDMRRYIDFFRENKIDVLVISTWMSRQGDEINGTKVITLMDNKFELYESGNCPLCLAGEEIVYKNIRE